MMSNYHVKFSVKNCDSNRKDLDFSRKLTFRRVATFLRMKKHVNICTYIIIFSQFLKRFETPIKVSSLVKSRSWRFESFIFV